MYTLKDVANLLLCYEDVFKDEKPNVIESIKAMNMHKTISIICELISIRNSKISLLEIAGLDINIPFQTKLKFDFCESYPKNVHDFLDSPFSQKNCHIISSQMLLMLLKLTISIGNYDTLNTNDYEITDSDYKQVIQLQLALVSELECRQNQYIDANHFLYCTYHFNHDSNLQNVIARMYYMLEKIAPDKSNFDKDVQNEYRDYRNDFIKKYKYSPIEYIALLFWEVALYYDNRTELTYTSTWRNVATQYKNMINSKRIFDIIQILGEPIKNYQKWAGDTYLNEWDFSKFFASPFLLDNSNNYISISDVTLKNAFFEKLFWLIRDCYPKDDSRAMAFFGRLFEIYIKNLSKSAIVSNCEFIDEFSLITENNNVKSSELYIKKGAQLCAVEAKGFSVLLDCMIKNESIAKNNNKLFISPILQADAFLAKSQQYYFNDIDEYYIISVALDNINAVPDFYKQIYTRIESEKQCQKTKYYFNFSVTEYEMLMCLLERGINIFDLLHEYFTNSTLKPFSTFITDKHPEALTPAFVSEIWKNALTKMKEILSINDMA